MGAMDACGAACAPIHYDGERALRAVDQVLDHDYPQVLRYLGVPVRVVAVTYDAKT